MNDVEKIKETIKYILDPSTNFVKINSRTVKVLITGRAETTGATSSVR